MAFLPPIVPPGRRAADLVLHVEEAAARSRHRQLASAARHLYRGDRRWIPPIGSARRDALDVERNPLLQGGELGAFLAVAQNLGLGDETVGALAAWSAPGDPKDEQSAWGRWGLFEAINVEEVAERLFYESETWLFEHTAGIAGIRGPCSLEPLVPPGLLTDGFDAEPTALLPYNLPYYPEMIEGQGYEPGATWRAYSLDLRTANSHARPAAQVDAGTWSSVARAYSAEHEVGDGEVLIPGLVRWLDHLAGAASFAFNRSWEKVVGTTFRRGIAVVSEGEDGEGAAACFGIPDIAPALRLSRGRRFPFGWLLFEIGLRRARRLRVFPAAAPRDWPPGRLADLYALVAERAAEAGYRRMVIAPVSDDDERNLEALSRLGAARLQQFTIYEKVL